MNKIVVALMIVSMSLLMTISVSAQSKVDAVWQNLDRVDHAVTASHLSWNAVETFLPNLSVDPERMAAEARDRARQKGLPENIQQMEEGIARDSGNMSRAGFSSSSRMTFEYDGASISCDGEQASNSPGISQRLSDETARFLDLYDGTNSILLDSTALGGTPNKGSLYRDPSQKLRRSAPDFADTIFFVGTPVTHDFNPADTKIILLNNKRILLEKKLNNQFKTIKVCSR